MLIIITIITFTFSTLTLTLGNVKSLAQNHTPRKWQSQNFTPVFLPSLAPYAPFMASCVSFVGLGIGSPFLPPPATISPSIVENLATLAHILGKDAPASGPSSSYSLNSLPGIHPFGLSSNHIFSGSLSWPQTSSPPHQTRPSSHYLLS